MKERITLALRKFSFIVGTFLVVITVLRFYEWSLVASKIEGTYPVGAGIMYDICASASFVLFIAIPAISFLTLKPRVGYALMVSACSFYLVGSFGLIHYFAVTHIPLGADFFGYSWNDIQTTVGASAGLNIGTVILLLACIGSFVTICYLRFRHGLIERIPDVLAIGVVCLIATIPAAGIRPATDAYDDDLEYYARVSKADFFIQRSSQYFRQFATSGYSVANFPFLHPIKRDDTLSEYFNLKDSIPNIVLIIVEGLGRDFVGDDAPYTGFTPFLDSLGKNSLYWKNALSNAGRTFGALPSILGSLPYGKEGFMSYGSKMPAHHTLISLLRPYGYTSNFFYGGNPNFDNQDIFMEAQGVNFILDETKFPATYEKAKTNSGFSWGYPDRDVFDYSLKVLQEQRATPRVDVYLTLSTHEPFQVPDPSFKELFKQKLNSLPVNHQAKYLGYKNIFECLLYTDHALEEYFAHISRLPGYDNTIFIVTGDHRLVPIPAASKLSRYHVPLMIFSPMLKKPQTFEGLVTHADVAPAVLNLLHHRFSIRLPENVSFISSTTLTRPDFSSEIDIALIRNKNETLDYVEGTHMLCEGRLFAITPNMDLEPVVNDEKRTQLTHKLKTFVEKSVLACEKNQLIKEEVGQPRHLFSLTSQEESFLKKCNVDTTSIDMLFEKARTLAFEQNHEGSRILARYILNKSPNHHDARILLARTFAWDAKYDTARYFLNQVLTRSPHYEDALIACIDVEYWSGRHDQALALSQSISQQHTIPDIKARLARSLFMVGKKEKAREILHQVLQEHPEHELSHTLLVKLDL